MRHDSQVCPRSKCCFSLAAEDWYTCPSINPWAKEVAGMKWASAISEATPLDSAIQECVNQVKQQLGDMPPQLAVIFVSSHYESAYDQAVELVREKLGSPGYSVAPVEALSGPARKWNSVLRYPLPPPACLASRWWSFIWMGTTCRTWMPVRLPGRTW